jgi:hypothetical protein
MAYRRMNAGTLGQKIGKDGPDTVKKWKGGNVPKANRKPILDSIAAALDLPVEWFTADLQYIADLPTHPLFLDTALGPMPGEDETPEP